MSLATHHDHPQTSHEAEQRIRAAAPTPNGASKELTAYVAGFVAKQPEPFTYGNVQFEILSAEIRAGKGEEEVTSDSSAWRGLDALKATGQIVECGKCRRGTLYRRVKTQTSLFE